MKTIGNLVEEAIDLMNVGLVEQAIAPAAAAIGETARIVGEPGERFVKSNWDLIAFMGLPRALPLSLNISFQAKRIVPQLNANADAREITAFLISETSKIGRLPNNFSFADGGEFEIKANKICLPAGLIFGLLGSVIFAPENKNESIGDQYWMNVGDFKMFISELWGRRDLAERIMKFYAE